MAGRKPLPNNLHVLHGNPGKRARNKNEPKPEPIAPSCPRWLDGRGKAEWKRISGELEKLGLLTKVDRAAMAAYCQLYSRYSQLEEAATAWFKANGSYTYEDVDKNGIVHIKIIPELTEARKYAPILRGYITEFGMTASARARLTLPGDKEEDEFEAFINQGKTNGGKAK